MSSELLPPVYRTPWKPPGPPPWYRRLFAWGNEQWRIINGDAERELEQRAAEGRRALEALRQQHQLEHQERLRKIDERYAADMGEIDAASRRALRAASRRALRNDLLAFASRPKGTSRLARRPATSSPLATVVTAALVGTGIGLLAGAAIQLLRRVPPPAKTSGNDEKDSDT